MKIQKDMFRQEKKRVEEALKDHLGRKPKRSDFRKCHLVKQIGGASKLYYNEELIKEDI